MKNLLKNPVKLQTVGEWGPVDETVRFALTLQTIFGYQVLDPNWSWKNVYKRYLVIIILYTYIFLGCVQCFKTTTDPDIITEVCQSLVLMILHPVRIFLFVQNRKIFCDLYLDLKTVLVEQIKAQRDLSSLLRKESRLMSYLKAGLVIPIAFHEFTVLNGYMKGDYMPLSKGTSTLLPLESPYFEIALIWHSLGFLIIGSAIIIQDMWFLFLTDFLSAANDVLVKMLDVEKQRSNESAIMYGKRLNKVLHQFYQSHIKQMKFLSAMNKMFKWLSLIPLWSASLCMCFILGTINTSTSGLLVSHSVIMISEIFAYNYFGEVIKTKAADIDTALLNFDWTGLSLKDRKNYYIIITYTRRDFGIKTATEKYLSFINMTAILQFTYRAVNMLRSL